MRYHNITRDDMLNGDGLRVVLWVAGCSHCCKDCHNPITWDPDGGVLFDEQARQELFGQLEKPYISGITFSGGDPRHAANRLAVRRCVFHYIAFPDRELMEEIRERYPDKTIWLYTGDKWEDIRHYTLLEFVDVLVDGEFVQDLKDTKLRWRGSANQRVIDVQASLQKEDPSVPVLHCSE